MQSRSSNRKIRLHHDTIHTPSNRRRRGSQWCRLDIIVWRVRTIHTPLLRALCRTPLIGLQPATSPHIHLILINLDKLLIPSCRAQRTQSTTRSTLTAPISRVARAL